MQYIYSTIYMILYDKICSSISLCKIAFSNIEMLHNIARIYLTLQVVSGICIFYNWYIHIYVHIPGVPIQVLRGVQRV
jgi:hypothetical protein